MHAKPKYCPWCGSDIKQFGHDDSCDRPKDVELIVKADGLEFGYDFGNC